MFFLRAGMSRIRHSGPRLHGYGISKSNSEPRNHLPLGTLKPGRVVSLAGLECLLRTFNGKHSGLRV
jgi:hypothetical protein